MTDALMHNYARLPVTFSRGTGSRLWDDQGREYLDAIAGIAVCSLGHAHPRIAEAIADQARTLLHTSNIYGIAHQQHLAERLTALADMDSAFFCNSGAEANEAAIKLARLHGHARGCDRPSIVVTEGSFHGRTLATLSATGNRKVQAGFEPLVGGFVRVPYDDVEAIERLTDPQICAVLVEPIQGEGGVVVPAADYLNRLRELCDQRGWLLMLDEIQTGIGRTGRWFAHQHNAIRPDVMTLAKALGNGVPIGACLARGSAAALFQPGHHGSTYGGNPLACRAALSVLDLIEEQDLLGAARDTGQRLIDALRAELGQLPAVVSIRGLGMMIGIELDRPCTELVGRALERGLLINVTAGRVIRLLPPLILDGNEAQRLVEGVASLVRGHLEVAA